MRISTGSVAPPFATVDVQGNPVTLEPFTGKLLLLSFFRSASCPLCSLRAYYMIQRYPALQARGLAVISVFETSIATTEQYIGAQKPPFPIVADPEKKLYQLYGVERSLLKLPFGLLRNLPDYLDAMRRHLGGLMSDGDHRLIPADFLIGPDLRVRVAHYGRDIGDHLPFAAIERALDDA